MDSIYFLIMRRMRAPLIMLIVSYAVAMLGFVIIPGQDAAGKPWSMGFFHALYVVAYTSSTIGFGEIPFAFTDAQRLWMTVTIFSTVAIWLYAVGVLIALLQDPTFRRARSEWRFAVRVEHLHEPFYLICGHGQTGSALVRALTDDHHRVVVIDIDPERINLLALETLREYVPARACDARRPSNLQAAGLTHPKCQGVVALTDNNETNLKIAIVAKLLRPDLRVVCRADSHEVEANMASFGTDHIYDPFDTFALHMAIAIEAPSVIHLRNWLMGDITDPLCTPRHTPTKGLWVLCGFGRFGKAMYQHLKDQGLELMVMEASPHIAELPAASVVLGQGTSIAALEQAQIGRAAALVVGTDNDATNLAMIMTAKRLNPNLFVVARKNHLDNGDLFRQVGADVIMHPSLIIANGIRVRLTLPLLWDFINFSSFQEDSWADALLGRLCDLLGDAPPQFWQVTIDATQTPALCTLDQTADDRTLSLLLTDPRDRQVQLPALPLLLVHQDDRQLLPALNQPLYTGDQVLFCGQAGTHGIMDWTLNDRHVLHYLMTGEDVPAGWVWQVLARRRQRKMCDKG